MDGRLSKMSAIVDRARKVMRFLLSAYLWLHACFILDGHSTAVRFLTATFHLSLAETVILVVIIVFTFVAGDGLWQSTLNTLYIFFFPFILLFYAVYYPS